MEEEDNAVNDLYSLCTLLYPTYTIFNLSMYIETESPQWSIMNWPFIEVSNDICSSLLEKGTYDVQPLAAYTANETLISPQDYAQELSGSIFAIPWNDSKPNKIVHTTELVQIHVITKASQIQAKSPKKRLPPSKPLFGSSSKKHFF